MFTQIKWVNMKTYNIKQEKDILKILENNVDIKNGTNAFEIVFKDMNKPTQQRSNELNMEILKFESNMVPLQIKKMNGKVHIIKKKSQKYDIVFVNVKNRNWEYFSALLNHIDPNDRILIINGHLLEYSLIGNNKKSSIVSVQSETNTKLIHFKFNDYNLDAIKPLYQNNLSKLDGFGVYSLFGNISKTLKYKDEDLMLLRIQCCDKSCIETHKYPHYVYNFKDISKEEKRLGVKSDFHSNQVDILVEAPSNVFLSLFLGQRIFLNNIKVDFSTDLNMFYLHLSGVKENLEASPTGTGIINSLVPHRKHYKIPNELKPITRRKIQRVCDNGESNELNRFQKLDENNLHKVSDLFSDVLVDNFASSTIVSDKGINVKRTIDMQCPMPTKRKKLISNCQTHNQIQNYVEVLQNSLSDEDTLPLQSNSQDLCTESLVSSGSPPFFTQDYPDDEPVLEMVDNVVEFKSEPKSTKCIGCCRLIYIEPYISPVDQTQNDFINGYCPKCFSFFPISSLIKSKLCDIYYCPTCEDVIHLTFFFKITFLYGQNDGLAMEVACYNDAAERVIKKLTKKKINIENYAANRKFVTDTMKSFIQNKTRVNIIIEESPMDNINVLRDIDTKFIVTYPI